MNIEAIIEQIDAEISKLQQARKLLEGSEGSLTTTIKRGPGRPKRSNDGTAHAVASIPTKRVLSAEAKAEIAEAQRRRWAKSRKAAKATKVAPAKAA